MKSHHTTLVRNLLGMVALVAAGSAAHAQNNIYQCKSDSGKIISTDKPGGDCYGKETRVVAPDGRTVRVIAAPMTQEQKNAKATEDLRLRDEDKRKREQRRVDLALLDTYRDMNDLEAKRIRALEQVKSDVAGSESRIKALGKINAELMQEAEFYKKKVMPADLRRKLDDNEAGIKGERSTLASKEQEVMQVNARFDSDKKRLLELTDASKPANAPAAPTAQPALPDTKGAPAKKS